MSGSPEASARPLIGADVVVVDVETTGLVPAAATIIEVGAVRLSGGQVTGEFFSLVNPATPIPPDITDLTGITDAMVARAPSAAAALGAFLAFARGAVLAAHNAPFDLAFLTSGCRASGLAWPPAAVLDTAVLARLLLGADQVPDCKLATLAGYFAVTATPCHRALADAQATGEVLLGLLDVAAAPRPPDADRLPPAAVVAGGLPEAGSRPLSAASAGRPAAWSPALVRLRWSARASRPCRLARAGSPVPAHPCRLTRARRSGGGRCTLLALPGRGLPAGPRRRPWSPLSS